MSKNDPQFYTTTLLLRDDLNGDRYLRITLSVGFYRTGVTAEIGTKKGWKMKDGVKVPDMDWKTVGQNSIEELNTMSLRSCESAQPAGKEMKRARSPHAVLADQTGIYGVE